MLPATFKVSYGRYKVSTANVKLAKAVHKVSAGGFKVSIGKYKISYGGYKVSTGDFKVSTGKHKSWHRPHKSLHCVAPEEAPTHNLRLNHFVGESPQFQDSFHRTGIEAHIDPNFVDSNPFSLAVHITMHQCANR